MTMHDVVTSPTERPTDGFPWGAITWLFNGELVPSAEMTFGHVVIEPGQSNPLHSHDCEEVLFLLEGTLVHTKDDEEHRLEAGQAIRLPAGARHNALNDGDVPARMVIAYSRANRSYEVHE